MEQRSDGGGGSAFDHELATLHDPDHRVEDLAIGKRHDVIHEALDHGEIDLADPTHAQAINDRLAVDGLEMTGFDALLHRWAVRRFDADYANSWVVALDGHRYPGDQPAPADRHDHRVDVGPVLHDLQAESALSGDELLIIEGVHVGESLRAHQLFRLFI